MAKANRITKNDEAVSPIVATLVLIVVAIVGAAAVGLLMGSFSNDVSKKASSAGTTDQATMALSIAGSTTVKPVADALAASYMGSHPGIKVNVQGGGSGVGITSAGTDVVDIGTSSEPLTTAQSAKFPNLVSNEIAKGAVCVIAGKGVTNTTVSKFDLQALYDWQMGYGTTLNGTTVAWPATLEVVYRADSSGTQGVFGNYLYGTGYNSYLNESTGAPKAQTFTTPAVVTTVQGCNGGSAVVAEVGKVANSIGFADFDAVTNAPVYDAANNNNMTGIAPKIQILAILDPALTSKSAAKDNGFQGLALRKDILSQMKDPSATKYPNGLIRPLLFLTNGQPNSVEQAFISFAKDPSQIITVQKAGAFAFTEYNAA